MNEVQWTDKQNLYTTFLDMNDGNSIRLEVVCPDKTKEYFIVRAWDTKFQYEKQIWRAGELVDMIVTDIKSRKKEAKINVLERRSAKNGYRKNAI